MKNNHLSKEFRNEFFELILWDLTKEKIEITA